MTSSIVLKHFTLVLCLRLHFSGMVACKTVIVYKWSTDENNRFGMYSPKIKVQKLSLG